jgi:hypothetical protein
MPTFPHESTHWYARIDQWSVESVVKVYYYAQGHAVNDVPIRKGGGGTGLIMTPISQSVTLVGSVATLGTPAFTIWEQRPYLVRFKNYQPITGREEFMYQNTTLLPLRSTDSNINHICLVIYDVTDVATNRHQLQAANAQLRQLSSIDRLTGLYNRGYWEESLVLSDTGKAGARFFAERLRKAVEGQEVLHDGRSIRFTISLGVADLSQPSTNHADLIT